MPSDLMIDMFLPDQTGNAGKKLITDGITCLWDSADAWPFDYYTTDLISVVRALGSLVSTLVITSPQVLTTSLSIPDNISIEIKQGGIITVPPGDELIIYGSFNAGLYQCFSGTGLVTLTKASVVYPEWFGTIDGVNDEVQIQAAIATGKPVMLGPTTYIVAVGVEMKTGSRIYGCGRYSTIVKLADNSLETFSYTKDGSGNYPGGIFKATGKTNIVISDIGFDGNRSNQAGAYRAHNLMFADCSYVTVGNCYGKSASHEGFTFWGSPYCTATNCHTTDNGNSGISTAFTPGFTEGTEPVISEQSNYFTCTNNLSINDGQNVTSAVSINAQHCTVANNTIINPGLSGYTIGHESTTASRPGTTTQPAQDASYSTFSASTLDGCGVLANHPTRWGAGIFLGYAPHGVAIDGLTITDSHGHGISATGVGTSIAHTVISNNRIKSSIRSGISFGAHTFCSIVGNIIDLSGTATPYGSEGGIKLNGLVGSTNTVLHTIINGNICKNTAGSSACGIIITDAKGLTVSENICTDDQGTKTQIFGLSITDCTDMVVSRNRLWGNVTKSLYLSAASAICLSKNILHPTDNMFGVVTISASSTTTSLANGNLLGQGMTGVLLTPYGGYYSMVNQFMYASATADGSITWTHAQTELANQNFRWEIM